MLLAVSTLVVEHNSLSASTWGASCPQVIDRSLASDSPKVTGFGFTGTGQRFSRVGADGRTPVDSPVEVVGCYVSLSTITGPEPGWQIGVINRDEQGYYWQNAANRRWRLTLDPSGEFFRTGDDAPYRESGDRFLLLPLKDEFSNCKGEDLSLGGVRTGFPKVPTSLTSIGVSRNLMVVVDFGDETWEGSAITVAEELASPKLIENFFESNSYGLLDLQFVVHPAIVRMQKPASAYFPVNGSYFVNGDWLGNRLATDLVTQLQSTVNFSSFESVSIIVASPRHELAFGGASPGFRIRTSSGLVQNTSVVGRAILADRTVPGWKVMAHEIGHLFGFADFYISGDGNTGKSPGPFDIMGNTTGTSHSFFGWHRWIQNWLADSQVICDLGAKHTGDFQIRTLMGSEGPRLWVSRLSRTRLLLAEMRTDTEFDRLGPQAGVLFYLLNLETPTLQGPVSILHSEEDRPVSWSNDVDRYSRATLTKNQTLRFEGRVFKVADVSAEAARVIVYTVDDYEMLSKRTVVPGTVSERTRDAITGRNCPRVGRSQVVGKVRYRCLSVRQKRIWQRA